MQKKEEQLREEEEKVEYEQQQQQQRHSDDDDDDSDFEFDIEGASTPAEAAERIKRLSVRLTSGRPVPPPRKPSMLSPAPTASPLLGAPAPPPRTNRPSVFGNGNRMVQNSSPMTRKVSTVLPPPASRSMLGMNTAGNERTPIRKPPPPLPERTRRSTVANIPSKPVTKTIHARCSPMNRPSFHNYNNNGRNKRDDDDEAWTFGRDTATTTMTTTTALPKRKPPPPLPARVRPPPPPLPSRQ